MISAFSKEKKEKKKKREEGGGFTTQMDPRVRSLCALMDVN